MSVCVYVSLILHPGYGIRQGVGGLRPALCAAFNASIDGPGPGASAGLPGEIDTYNRYNLEFSYFALTRLAITIPPYRGRGSPAPNLIYITSLGILHFVFAPFLYTHVTYKQ